MNEVMCVYVRTYVCMYVCTSNSNSNSNSNSYTIIITTTTTITITITITSTYVCCLGRLRKIIKTYIYLSKSCEFDVEELLARDLAPDGSGRPSLKDSGFR